MSLIKNMIRLNNRNSILSCISLKNILHTDSKSSSYITRYKVSSYSTKGSQDFRDSPKFKAFKAKQAKMQCDDGYPVHLKGGLIDKILYHITVGACIIGLIQCFWLFYILSKS